jgi:serine/threonine protein kinase
MLQRRRINGYELLDDIGLGTFSKVYLARHISTGKNYAVKEIRKDLSAKVGCERLRISAISTVKCRFWRRCITSASFATTRVSSGRKPGTWCSSTASVEICKSFSRSIVPLAVS